MNQIRMRHAIVALAAVGAALAGPALAAAPAQSQSANDIAALAAEVDALESARAIKNLQRAYGFYIDRALWDEASDLFADDATIELGADGVYAGKARILEYLKRLGGGRIGIAYGQLREHIQLQPVVHVSGDTAKARWRDLAMTGDFGKHAEWGDGVYENTYVRQGGVWKIQSVHLYVNFIAPFESGWARLQTATGDLRSDAARAFPSDRPSSAAYKRFPEVQVPAFHYPNPATVKPAKARPGPSDPALAPYRARVERLKDKDDIENLQAAYGYYFDKSMWGEVAALFSKDGTFEYGQRGVYVGAARIHQGLKLIGAEGPEVGKLNNHYQLQPIIHVAPDGLTAKARWRGMLQLGRRNASGAWGDAVYENDYVKEGGVWKIAKLHAYITGVMDYEAGWKNSYPLEGPSALLPPDRPPSEVYRAFPGVYVPPFHYMHPVTGKPITSEQPADLITRPAK